MGFATVIGCTVAVMAISAMRAESGGAVALCGAVPKHLGSDFSDSDQWLLLLFLLLVLVLLLHVRATADAKQVQLLACHVVEGV